MNIAILTGGAKLILSCQCYVVVHGWDNSNVFPSDKLPGSVLSYLT